MIQGIVGERGFPKDPILAEDEIFYRLGELASGKDPVITTDEAFDCFNQYIESTRPDAKVIHLGEFVSRPFYE
jgi:hypothetical protein